MKDSGYFVSPSAKATLWMSLGWLVVVLAWLGMSVANVPLASAGIGWIVTGFFAAVLVGTLGLAGTRVLRYSPDSVGPVVGRRAPWGKVARVRVDTLPNGHGRVRIDVGKARGGPDHIIEFLGTPEWADDVATQVAGRAKVKKVVVKQQAGRPNRNRRKGR